jgi:hypothetical protein
MPYIRMPLSGNLWQDINPFRWIFGPNAQLSLFSVNLGRSSAPETEEAILEVASYGRQLGRLGEALLALLEQPDSAHRTDAQKHAIEDFKALMRDITAAKKRAEDGRTRPAALVPWSPSSLTTRGD